MSRPWCKHYYGMHKQNTCEAGVKFASLKYYGTTQFISSCPCFGPELGECSQATYPTAEEMAAHDAEIAARFEKTVKARAAILAHCDGGKEGTIGTIDFPACGGKNTLEFRQSGYNGHISAKCQTEDCVHWVE